jgi:hypothetical protein
MTNHKTWRSSVAFAGRELLREADTVAMMITAGGIPIAGGVGAKTATDDASDTEPRPKLLKNCRDRKRHHSPAKYSEPWLFDSVNFALALPVRESVPFASGEF